MLRVFAMGVNDQNFLDDRWNLYLSEIRKQEAKRHRREQERRLFLGAEVLLNRSIEMICRGVVLPVAYRRNEYGKPYLTSLPDLYVNWSHSGEYVLCAVADREVGIDLQYMGKEPKASLVSRVLQPEEAISYEKTPEKEKKKRFYEYWTIKESYLKAVGTGLHTSLDQFYVRMEGPHPKIIQREKKEVYDCRLLDFADSDYAAAVCCTEEVPVVAVEYL